MWVPCGEQHPSWTKVLHGRWPVTQKHTANLGLSYKKCIFLHKISHPATSVCLWFVVAVVLCVNSNLVTFAYPSITRHHLVLISMATLQYLMILKGRPSARFSKLLWSRDGRNANTHCGGPGLLSEPPTTITSCYARARQETAKSFFLC